MYVTTSRKCSQAVRTLARSFANLLNSTYENRGKKSIEDVVERARKLGMSRAVIIGESHGSPSSLSFIGIGKGWDWLREVRFRAKTIPKIKRIKKEVLLVAGKEWKDLFDFEEPRTDDVVNLQIKKNRMNISYKDNKLTLRLLEGKV